MLLSGGVDDETFERQVDVACRAGASGVLVGRSVWAEAAQLDPAARDAFLETTGRQRLARLTALVDERGGPVEAALDRGAAPGTARPRLVRAVLSVPTPGIPRERDIDLLVVGEINPDVVVSDPDPRPVFGQAERIVDAIRLSIGSSSAITACGAARLGLRVSMVGVVGDDALGRFMLEALAARGVDVSACRVDPDRPTGASVILGNGTDRAILTATGTIADARASDVPAALLARARHLHVGSYFLQPSLAADVPALFRAARAAGLTTSLDPNWDPSGAWDGGFAAAAAEADVLLPNAVEASRLTGIDDVTVAARSLADGDGARIRTVVVKLGPAGALGVGPGGALERVSALPVTPVDTTGAGDSFDAGFLAAWLDGRPLVDALRRASPAGPCPRAPSAARRASRRSPRLEAALAQDAARDAGTGRPSSGG